MSALNRSIALAGAGAIGIPILRALLNHPNHPKVVVLTRPGSKKDLPSDLSSATVIPVDYTDVAALTALFKEHSIEVVISTVPPPGYVTAQHALADAAKASGSVKLFVPSEWGVPTEGAKGEHQQNQKCINGMMTYTSYVIIATRSGMIGGRGYVSAYGESYLMYDFPV